ncbi:YceI family protein [Mangrovimonas sp. AS39]|uniref:YceI family protein n=1 Tax=Mangrovimonas futianensis TaxID=2895523 RepID=UPI001E634E36|nr:YceI family protein [Mangrovimonas futianensis]MCF1192074.1 YceI family protein [Mangrovimonas futianensis]MCF1195768.1 YceI family protein [Mangrovimonas futianensis]
MKPIILILVSVLCFKSLVDDKGFNEATYLISERSELKIIGSTNVNKFTCAYDMSRVETKQRVNFRQENDKLVFTNTDLILKSTAFDCGSKMINKDFNKLMQTDVFPDISLKLIEITKENIEHHVVYTTMDVTICNRTKRYKVPVNISDSVKLGVKGNLRINITDYELEAPKKAMGMIKVCNDIDIDFNLFFQKL